MRKLRKAIKCTSSAQMIARVLIFAIAFSITAACFTQVASAENTYIITDGDNVIVHVSSSTDPQAVIAEAGLTLGESDLYTTAETENGVSKINIQRVQMVTVNCDGQKQVVGSYGETAAEILTSLGISLAGSDRLSCALTDESFDGMVIDVTRVTSKTLEYDEVVSPETVYYEDRSLGDDETYLLAEGADGKVHRTAYVTYEDGVEVDRVITSEAVITPVKNEIILCGKDRSVKKQVRTAEPIAPTAAKASTAATTAAEVETPAPSPEQIAAPAAAATAAEMTVQAEEPAFSGSAKTLSCLATAYSCDGRKGITATGTVVHIGTVAVDPRVIPLGSKLYIVSDDGKYIYGYSTAEDTGGLIKGNRVDLYFNSTAECIQFGARNVTVYVLD